MSHDHDEKDAKGEQEEGCKRHHLILCSQCSHDAYVQGLRDRVAELEAARVDTARIVAHSPVIDGLTCAGILTAEHEADPRKALSDLIGWEVAVALDPRVSPDAAGLAAEAVATEQRAIMLMCIDLHDPFRPQPWNCALLAVKVAVHERLKSTQPDAGEKA